MDLKIVMVEGPHDGAFISKIMQVHEFKTCKVPIGDYQPKFIAKYLGIQYKKAPVDQLNLQSVRQEILFPSYSLIQGNCQLLIFQMNGDSRADRRNRLVREIFGFVHSTMTADAMTADDKITFVYEFDADEMGVAARLQQVNDEIRLIDSECPAILANGEYVESKGIRWGAFIFADTNGKGKLEDIILPMMEIDNEDIATCAKELVDRRDSFILFRGKKTLKHPLKARIGVMGQLDKEGSANPAIIEQSSYLTSEKIKKSPVCESIFSFLSLVD